MSDDSILRTNDLLAMLGVSRSTLFRWVRAGLLPPGIKLGQRAVGWRRSTIERWIEERESQAG